MSEKLKGYNGKIAYINLSSQSIDVKELDPKIAEDYIGGVSLSAKILYDMLSEADYETLKKDSFSSINPIIFATGPLTATATPSSSRYSVCGISPLTGIWGESTSGGFFPVALKKCGFDALVITGESEKPIYMIIENGNISFRPAEAIWGKNTRETTIAIRNELSSDSIRIACIGKGGENLVKYAGVINDEGRAAGRCGFGALMGKKKLKALAVKGTQPIEYDDRKKLAEDGRKAIGSINVNFSYLWLGHYGTLCYSDLGAVFGDVPGNYFTNTVFPAESLTGKRLGEEYPVMQYKCAGCSIGCGRTTIAEIDGVETEIDGPEYETAAAYGTLCGIYDFKPVLKAHHVCNLEGVDVISSGVSIAFLIYLVENKLAIDNISKLLRDMTIEEIKWGNEELGAKLLNQIINREGIGNLLAEGTRIMARELGVDPGLAAHVKGLEIPMHDPRAYLNQALSYMTCCTGANHNKGDIYGVDSDFGSFGRVRKDDRFTVDGREILVKEIQDIRNIFDSAVMCNWSFLPMPIMTKLFKNATGIKGLANKKTLLQAAERGNTLKRLISCKLGCTREDDQLPKIVTTPLSSGGSRDIEINLEHNLKVYYELAGWDWETGAPTKEKLQELGI